MQRFNRKFRGGRGPKLWSQESNDMAGSWPVRNAHCVFLSLSRYESRRTFHARIGSGISPGDCAVVSSRPCECGENQWTLSGAIQASAGKTTAGPASDMQLSSVSFPSLVSKALRPWAKSYGTPFAISPWPFWVPAPSLEPFTSSWPTRKWWDLDWSLSAAARLLKEVARTVLPWRSFGGDQVEQIEGLWRRWVLLANAVVAVPAPV